MTGQSRPHDQTPLASLPSEQFHRSGRNVFCLIALREVSPRRKHVPKRQWGKASKPGPESEAAKDARRGLLSWVEAETLRHLSAMYCPLVPPPRSTIAAAFSPDGRTLASTHGDHTVKIIDCQSGSCLKVLSGHRRTPWVVRFHPLHPEILASGSLDYEVRLWDASTSECIGSRDFYRPIASIAFHAKGDILAVASGHKLYLWHYNKRGESSSPIIALRTRRSLRAVHFHPHAAPFLLTAEVNDLNSSDSSMTRATSLDDSRTTDLQRSNQHVGSSSLQVGSFVSTPFQMDANEAPRYDGMLSLMETFPAIPNGSHSGIEEAANNHFPSGTGSGVYDLTVDAMETDEMQPVGRSQHGTSTNLDTVGGANTGFGGVPGYPGYIPNRLDLPGYGEFHQLLPRRDPSGWELPFLQGWLMGQSQAGLTSMLPLNGDGGNLEHSAQYSSILTSRMSIHNVAMPGSISLSGISGRSGLRHHFPHSHFSASESVEGAGSVNAPNDRADTQPIMSRIQSEITTSLAAATAAELPCTVKLRVWSHDINNPFAQLNPERCCLIIPHAVLCSEMGAHFSPCGKFLAACVACTLPHMEADPGYHTLIHQDPGAATSPTRHPVSAHQVIYELRIYSLEKATFGSVLVSRAIRAAHCLTSIQFSPTSEHILLAYGRRHGSLLKSIVIDEETTLPIYTVLEVYRVSDMELVGVLPSAEDEVNVACFHPFAGGGLVYGTKEGKLRVLQCDGGRGVNCTRSIYFPEENMALVG
ncbi:hypothetical protein F2P56_003081 [Juglans regia]|uniref:Activating molecule in BECN1-regulated autophagy protein 1-like n=2 Tax=Juglans regia TaxID=51240 RepID=A0A833YGW5_JUGRE|nr:uncharacterized protein LOC109012671 isoform X3 [Juglans regia]KAF5482520.1 hypothetical protein F2P56_003081 [Juglans regia]